MNPPEPVDILEEAVQAPADGQPLAGILAYPFAGAPRRAAFIVGPHPMMGGRLDNNVVRQTGRGLAECGWLSLRFEFGGEGLSPEVMDAFWKTGHAPDDPQRARETAAAFNWLTATTALPIVAVGYSFGASLLAGVVDEARVSHVVLIGATFAQHDYVGLAASARPKLVIAADNDFATPLSATERWYGQAAEPKRLIVVPAAEHFYRGQETRIVEEIGRWISE